MPAPSTPRLSDPHLAFGAAAYADVVTLLDQVFQAPASVDSDATRLLFGPVALTGTFQSGFAAGTVQRLDDGVTPRWMVMVRVGATADVTAMVTVLDGQRRGGVASGSTVDLVLLLRAGRAFTGGDGQVVVRQQSQPDAAAGPWSTTSVVTAEWQPMAGGAAALGVRATCGNQQRQDGALALGITAFFRDVNADTFPDHGTTLVVARPGVGGVGATSARPGSVPGNSTQALSECWDAAGNRLFVTATDGTTTVTEPPGGTAALCPAPFQQPLGALVLPDLDAAQNDARQDMVGRAYVGLHAPLVLPSQPQRVLWVGAHPDDEAFQAAPLLGHLCRDLGASCTFLVVTNGSTGSCRVPTGCPPDLGTWRTQEMVAAAAVYGATVDQWTWTPGEFPGDSASVLNAWALSVGSGQGLLDAIAGVVETVQPDIIITMDPRHGLSCHAEHRVVSQLTLAAVNSTALRPTIYLGQGWSFPPPAMDATWLSYDASQPSSTTGADTWDFIRQNLLAHPSQVYPDEVAAVAQVPVVMRRMWVLPAANLQANDARYDYCPNP